MLPHCIVTERVCITKVMFNAKIASLKHSSINEILYASLWKGNSFRSPEACGDWNQEKKRASVLNTVIYQKMEYKKAAFYGGTGCFKHLILLEIKLFPFYT